VDADALLRQLRTQFSTLEDAERVVVAEAPELGVLVTDEDKVQRVLTNLVENALKYAPEGAIEVAGRRSPDGTLLTVSDHGPGIPPAERERIFERFVQLDQSSTRRQGGTGLGLYLCRQLATVLNGRLELEDTPGGGCTFTLVLPIDHDTTVRTDQSHRVIADDQGDRHDDLGGLTTLRRSG
jgi:signal transduction histidine kinase